MEKNCITQIKTPEVDNTAMECDELISSKCIIVDKLCKKVGNLENESLNDFIGRLCVKLAIMDNKISLLTQQLENCCVDISTSDDSDMLDLTDNTQN